MAKILGYILLAHDRRIELVRGDLTEEHVDVIVNAANQWLQHGAGVAGAIIHKGGSIIQKESNEWVAKHGSVTRDQPAYTGAGRLSCRNVIHAVGPVWGEGNEEEKLYHTIMGALNLAVQLKAQTLSIPPISTGIFGFPKEKAAPIFYKAISDFWLSDPDCPLDKIRITIIDDLTSNVFLTALEQWNKENHKDGSNES
jgi:O-acetyl-ADP-ribose deacetylase (regulator of RNase III)